MPYLQLHDRQFPLPAGEATIGAHEGASIRLPGAGGSRAIMTVSPGGASIRRGSDDSVVLINGVQLGVEPSPVLHGDRIEIDGHELRLGEDQTGGSTQFVSASDAAAMAQARAAGVAPRKPTMATGGRLVSLVDGREYQVADAGLTFGREVGHDVVIASSEISRKHASIAPGPDGYVITDHSTNGVWVNGERMGDTLLLGRGDVIKMGTEEFRFYADVAKPAPAPAPVAEAPVTPPVTPPVAAPAPPAPAAPPPPPAAEPVPAAAPVAPPRVPLATLEILGAGPLKGKTFDLHSALTNIGRGEHNDICIKDESVSDSHAKLQKRADGWWIVDQESTNGTYVGGRRVQGEQRLEGAPDLRFGGIKMAFRGAAPAAEHMDGTRAIAAVNIDAARRAAASRTPALAKSVPPPAPEVRKKGCATVIVFFLTVAGTGAGLLALTLLVGR